MAPQGVAFEWSTLRHGIYWLMKIAFDVKEVKPGCALLQAALGCGTSIAHRFPPETWLLALTPALRIYEVTEAQLAKLVVLVEEKHSGR